MKNIILLRGSKSLRKKLLEENPLVQPYVVSYENLRNLNQTPKIKPKGVFEYEIKYDIDNTVWKSVYNIIEHRMSFDSLIVVDASHIDNISYHNYMNLAESYGYKVFMCDVGINESECTVSEIDRYNVCNCSEGIIQIPKDEFSMFFENESMKKDYSSYNKIHVIGDVHGMYETLLSYLKSNSSIDYFPDDELFIFCGDYIDRGPKSAKVILFLLNNLYKKNNIILLEGNHERHLFDYVSGRELRSTRFRDDTIPNIVKSKLHMNRIKKFLSYLEEVSYFTYKGKDYFVNHGGIEYLPANIKLVDGTQYINGMGSREHLVGRVWDEENTIQIHGHRNPFRLKGDLYPNSIILESSVEMGGNLSVYVIKEEGTEMILTKPRDKGLEGFQPFFIDSHILNKPSLSKMKSTLDTKSMYIKEQRDNKSINIYKVHPNIHASNDKATLQDMSINADIAITSVNNSTHIPYEVLVARTGHRTLSKEKLELNIYGIRDTVTFPTEVYYTGGIIGMIYYDSVNDKIRYEVPDDRNLNYTFRNLVHLQLTKPNELMKYLRKNKTTLVFDVRMRNSKILTFERDSVVLVDEVQTKAKSTTTPYGKLLNLRERFGLDIINKTIVNDWYTFVDMYVDFVDKNSKPMKQVQNMIFLSFATSLKVSVENPYYTYWKTCYNILSRLTRRNSTGKLINIENEEVSKLIMKRLKENPDVRFQDIKLEYENGSRLQ